MSRILFIEDEPVSQKIVTACLSQHEIQLATTLKSARDWLAQGSFDLILLDVKLPDGDGFGFLMELQQSEAHADVPVILLTGQSQSSDKVTGYSLGAEDYITKPLDPIVFKARIEAKIRKLGRKSQPQNLLKKDGFTLSLEKQSVTFDGPNGVKTLDLTTLEFKLFLHLFKHKDHVFSREQLIATVWGDAVNVTDRTVDSHISHLRKRLSDSNLTIQSVYGAGYKLTNNQKAA